MKTRAIHYEYSRSSDGHSLIEMLATLFIMSFVAAAVTELGFAQNLVAFRTFNKLDALGNAKRLTAILRRDVHQARYFGDQFGSNAPNQSSSNSTPNLFPANSAQNPYSLSGCLLPSTTFSGWPSNWPPPPYQLDEQTLIVQVPVYTIDGFPTTAIDYGTSNTLATKMWNVDTFVYKVIPDSTRPGQGLFTLQRAYFPGYHTASTENVLPVSSTTPQILLSGLVGPINPSDSIDPIAGTPTPRIFGYFTSLYPLAYAGAGTPASSLRLSKPTGPQSSQISGVSVNLEAYSDVASSRADCVPKTIAIHQEFYARSNTYSSP